MSNVVYSAEKLAEGEDENHNLWGRSLNDTPTVVNGIPDFGYPSDGSADSSLEDDDLGALKKSDSDMYFSN